MHDARLNRTGLLALCGGAIGIGFAPIFVRLSDVGPSATAFYRLLLALPVLWWWHLHERAAPTRPRQPSTRADFLKLTLAGLLFVGDLGIWHWSLQFTSVANSTLLANIAPIFVTLGAWMLFGESIRLMFLAGMALAWGGSAMLIGLSHGTGPDPFLGDVLSVIAAVFYAGYLLMIKSLRRDFSSLTIMAWSGCVACAGFWIAAWAANESLWPGSLRVWLILAGLALVSHLGGQTLIAFALGHLPASFSSLGLLLQPVIAGILAWILFGEHLSALQILGASLVLGGIALATQKRERRTGTRAIEN